jgi:hypothetical protein
MGCAKNMPARDTELGRIARIGDSRTRATELKQFTKRHLRNREDLRRELTQARFQLSTFRDETGKNCERFDWTGQNWGATFPSYMFVNICGNEIFADAGQDAL